MVEAVQWAVQQTPEQSHSKKCQIIIAPAWIWLDDTAGGKTAKEWATDGEAADTNQLKQILFFR